MSHSIFNWSLFKRPTSPHTHTRTHARARTSTHTHTEEEELNWGERDSRPRRRRWCDDASTAIKTCPYLKTEYRKSPLSVIRFPAYSGPNYWGTIRKNSLHFRGSHPWAMNFPAENGSHLARIRHLPPARWKYQRRQNSRAFARLLERKPTSLEERCIGAC
jgi:hypothetical protein